jgi:TRAP-type C4-dicarboxylate transport system substrate-binding protein
MKIRVFAALAVGLAAMAPGLVRADTLTYKYAFPAPPFSLLNQWGMTPYAQDVNKAAGGEIDMKLYFGPSLASFGNVYDRVTSGVIEVGFGMSGQFGGQFVKTEVASLPFLSPSCEAAAIATWRLYQNGILADEYERVKPLALFYLTSSSFHTSTKPLKTMEDFKGVKFAVTSRTSGQYLEMLGGVAISMQPSEVYQAMQRGLVGGTALGWPAVPTFKIEEVSKYHLDVFYTVNAGFVFMNKDAYAKLPEKAKAAVDKYSGEAYSARLGKVGDRMDEDGREKTRAHAGHAFTTIDAAELERWKKLFEPVTAEWARTTPDGAKVLAAYRAEIAKLQNSK